MLLTLVTLALALDCPEDGSARSSKSTEWCVDGDGAVHGSLRRDRKGVVEGSSKGGIPVGEWTLSWPDGTPRVSSPVRAEAVEGCDKGDGDCVGERVAEELAGWYEAAEPIAEPGIRMARSSYRLNPDSTTSWWGMWRISESWKVQRGFGLPAGKTRVWNRDGRIILAMEHDEAGLLTGTFTYHDGRGRPLRRAHFESGWLHGKDEIWGLGLREGEVHWVHGSLHGPVRWWDTEGKQIIQGGFMEGEPCSPFSIRNTRSVGITRRCSFVTPPTR